MRQLLTVQKRSKLNSVYAVDQPGNGGACHRFLIDANGEPVSTEIQMQDGPRNLSDSKHGVIDSDLLEIVRDRLKSFQAGPYCCRENAIALTYVEQALQWLNM